MPSTTDQRVDSPVVVRLAECLQGWTPPSADFTGFHSTTIDWYL